MKFRLIANSGLCARLLAIISGYRLAKLSQREFQVVWNKTGNETPCEFTDLFEEPDFPIGPGKGREQWHCPLDIYDNIDIDIWANRAIDNNWRLPKDEDLYEYCKILKPKQHILDEVDEFFSIHKPALGVHLRRTGIHLVDNCNVPYTTYINKKLSDNPGSKFFLSSDCKDTIDIFTQIYWGDIITFKGNTFKRNSVRDMEVALINILILSRCMFIVRSGLSGFSYLPCLLNKVPNLIL